MGTDFPMPGSVKYHLERLNINNVEAVSVVEERVVCVAPLLHVACSQSHSLTVAGHCRAARLGWVQPKLQSERSGHQTETPGLSTYIERGQVTLNTYYVIQSGY